MSRFNLPYLLLLGFASGLPLALTAGTLQAWLTVSGVDIKQIGLFALVGLPYTLKFLWAPLLDRFAPSFLDRRRSWMLLAQLGLIASLLAMAACAPQINPLPLAVFALCLAFFSATQDIAYDAYRTDILPATLRGMGTGLSVTGYRLAMLVSGALALILIDEYQLTWWNIYLLMAVLMGALTLVTMVAPSLPASGSAPRTLQAAIIEPFNDFFRREQALALLLLVFLYKLGDALAGSLTTTFLVRELGYTLKVVGVINKAAGIAATIFGVLLAGAWMTRLKLYPALMWFGILQAVTNFGFLALIYAEKTQTNLALVVILENFAGGMGTCAVTALLMALCNVRFSATQFALLSSLAALGRVLIGSRTGYIVADIGWSHYFVLSFLIAIPGLLLLYYLRQTVSHYEKPAGGH